MQDRSLRFVLRVFGRRESLLRRARACDNQRRSTVSESACVSTAAGF